MGNLFGQQLLKDNLVTNSQLVEALEHQRLNGGRLGHSLVALGFLKEEEVERFFRITPQSPQNIEASGLSEAYIKDLVLKHAVRLREFTLTDLSTRLKLPLPLMDQVVESLRKDQMVQVKRADQLTRLSYRFSLSDAGVRKAGDLFQVSRYAGPAPVAFKDYKKIVEIQTVKSIDIDEALIQKAFSSLVLSQELIDQLGPAVSSGKAIFFYGPPGNGKTTIAEIIGNVMPDEIYVPHAVDIDGEIISVFDHATHTMVEEDPENKNIDQRWIKVKRPVIMAGGEMTLKGLDLDFNPISKYYEAPLQMKANNGIFIVDDFGRQQVDSKVLLNRWIVPLERRTDFLTLHTGMKIEIPFDQLVIFSTNLNPSDLVDAAFLRRIRYKIKIDYPDADLYLKIFKQICHANQIEFDPQAFTYLMDELYKKTNTPLSACHCRDLLDWIIDHAHFKKIVPVLTKENLKASWKSYFVET